MATIYNSSGERFQIHGVIKTGNKLRVVHATNKPEYGVLGPVYYGGDAYAYKVEAADTDTAVVSELRTLEQEWVAVEEEIERLKRRRSAIIQEQRAKFDAATSASASTLSHIPTSRLYTEDDTAVIRKNHSDAGERIKNVGAGRLVRIK